MTLRADLVGTTGEPVEVSWTADDVMLYALAIGAGSDDPTSELGLTTENTAGLDGTPWVVPTYAAIITRGARVDLGDIDRTRLVHAEQSVRVHVPLPAQGTALVTGRVTAVEPRSSGALVRTALDAIDAATGAPLASTVQTVLIRGEEVTGPRSEAPPSPVPDRDPDERIVLRTRPEQALLYRLTGDRNPLHTDPAFAARGGFDRPILHGMCTYGFTARALIRAVAGGDPSRLLAMDARFTRPVVPGAELEVALWREPDGTAFRTSSGGATVVDRGWCEWRSTG